MEWRNLAEALRKKPEPDAEGKTNTRNAAALEGRSSDKGGSLFQEVWHVKGKPQFRDPLSAFGGSF